MYIDCPPYLTLSGVRLQCPTPNELQRFDAAVMRGDIVWHAGPYNLQVRWQRDSAGHQPSLTSLYNPGCNSLRTVATLASLTTA